MDIEKLNLTVASGSRAYSADFNRVTAKIDEIIENLGSSLTVAEVAWVSSKVAEELAGGALSKYSVSTNSESLKVYADTYDTSSVSRTVTVTTMFDGSAVDADSVPSGWSRSGTGTYTRSITVSSYASATTFEYTIPSDNQSYGGIKVSKKSAEKKLDVVNPAWYGITSSIELDDIGSVIASNGGTRIVEALSATKNISNSSSSSAYLFIVTKGTATATQLGSPIIGQPRDMSSFQSPNNSSLTMSGYKVYVSSKSIAAGGSLDGVNLNINLK